MQQALTHKERPDARPNGVALGDWLTPGRFSLVLGLLIAAAFPQVLLGLQTFVVRDFGFFAYPLAHFQREAFWRGELPLWNPYNNCGVPFLAQWNTMPLYPPTLIYMLLPLSWSLSFFCLLHLFWAGLGMYHLAHRWTANRLAAAAAGLVFAFNGFSLNLLMWPSHIATLSWMPWVVLLVELGWQEGGRKLIVAALCGALQMLAGGPETILLTWLLLSAMWIIQLLQARRAREERGRFGKLLLRFPLIVVLVAALAAAQLLPFLDLAAHSQREAGYADTRWSMPARGWANFLVPMVFGHVWNMGLFFQDGQAWTSSYYLGVGTLLLAAMSLWRAGHWRVWLLGGAAMGALLLAMGNQSIVYRALRHVLPQLSLVTYPVKFLILVALAGPLLAAFGFARLQRLGAGELRVVRSGFLALSGGLLGLIAAILVWAYCSPQPGDDLSAALRNGVSRAVLLLIITVVVLGILPSREQSEPDNDVARTLGGVGTTGSAQPLSQAAQSPSGRMSGLQPFLPLILLLLLWMDVWTHEPNQNPSVPRFVYEPGLARAKLAMQPQPELFQSRAMLTPSAAQKFREFVVSSPKDNFLVKRLGYFADCNLLDSVPKVDGFFSLAPRESGDLLSTLYGSTNLSLSHLADFLAVSQISAPGEFVHWQPRTNFMPLVTAGQRPFFFDDAGMLNAVFSTNFDGSRVVCLLKEAQPLVSVSNATSAQILSSRFRNERVELEVEAAAASLLVISQTYYHPWRAYVDGHATPLLRANYAFQALEVGAGRHRVRVVYQDRAFQAGLVISALAICVCIISWKMGGAKTPITNIRAPEKLQSPIS